MVAKEEERKKSSLTTDGEKSSAMCVMRIK
jgi:hypothetical protein